MNTDGLTPDDQYNAFAHQWERHFAPHFRQEATDEVNQACVVYVDDTANVRAMALAQSGELHLSAVIMPDDPCIVVDSKGVVLLKDFVVEPNGNIRVKAMVTAAMEGDPGSDITRVMYDMVGVVLFTQRSGSKQTCEVVSGPHFRLFTDDVLKHEADPHLVPDHPGAQNIVEDFVHGVMTAVEQLAYFNYPQHYVIETTPKHVSEKPAKTAKGRITRISDRPVLRIVDPEAVRTIRDVVPSGAHASPVPHRRRAHMRTLRADRWGENKGKTIPVRPAWVGPEQWSHKRTVYRLIHLVDSQST